MDKKPPFRLVESETAHAKAQSLFERVHASLDSHLPTGTELRHIGATAVPGCLTKGDLDVVIRVPAQAFRDADAFLATRFQRNIGSIRTDNFSAFEDETTDPHLGIQLTAIDGPQDFFHLFVDELFRSPNLVHEYNDLKRSFDGSDMGTYRAAKNAFVESVLSRAQTRK